MEVDPQPLNTRPRREDDLQSFRCLLCPPQRSKARRRVRGGQCGAGNAIGDPSNEAVKG